MPLQVTHRAATPEERAALEKILALAPSSAARLKQGVVNGLMLWGMTSLGLIALWLVLGWFAGRGLGVDLGVGSPTTRAMVALIIVSCGVFAALSSRRWLRSVPDPQAQVRADLAAGQVREERYVFDAARRFQEPEHGGLMYFLRSAEDEVFPVHDHESQHLGAQGQDPLQSHYRPRAELLVVRAPGSGAVLLSQASGVPLAVGAPMALAAGPEAWPEAGELCGIAWSELDARLGPPAR